MTRHGSYKRRHDVLASIATDDEEIEDDDDSSFNTDPDWIPNDTNSAFSTFSSSNASNSLPKTPIGQPKREGRQLRSTSSNLRMDHQGQPQKSHGGPRLSSKRKRVQQSVPPSTPPSPRPSSQRRQVQQKPSSPSTQRTLDYIELELTLRNGRFGLKRWK